MSAPGHDHANEFEAAKVIYEKLKDLKSDSQRRVLRWISESLGHTEIPVAVIGSAATPTATPINPSIANSPASSVSDIKSFIASKQPKSDNQFAAAVAYFYRFEALPQERRETINGEVLQNATRLSGRNRLHSPKNTLNNAKAAGYLDSSAPGEFSINSVGENLVAMTLPGGNDTNATSQRKRNRNKQKNKGSKSKARQIEKKSR